MMKMNRTIWIYRPSKTRKRDKKRKMKMIGILGLLLSSNNR
jgi:hypothetical protein